ncbi:hypothetical protein K450DRAFT_240923 [Umbelopsis ramanniana AG]|uniref:EF-hand domain-containing protein n=1 Tax=Umbelopsis ramanniana AG TaxID=1314678 RepID=A0AAD5EAH2_UMBRA|nr:uncharacterized protein K450DRAFT_240923 [Umbelopsis ramanniana AG]KAI8579664.1 hypothetical protein K450DRAFT_240923 [Umbelopsis ramanniana AG]
MAKDPVQLLDDEDNFAPRFEQVLEEIFKRFDKSNKGSWTRDEINEFATQTNGKPFDKDTLEEIETFFEVTEEGNLTTNGFMQMYHLQTQNDPEETWKDLKTYGYDDNLDLVSSRTEDENPISPAPEK